MEFAPQEDNQVRIIVNQRSIGFMLSLNSSILGAFDIKNREVVLAQINLEQLFGCISLEKKFLSIPKYPAITRDVSFVINEDIPVKE